jgi:TolB protein
MPSFAPDGYFLAFSSSRTGQYKIYLTTRHGGDPRMVPTGPGEDTMPSWGFVPE